MVASIKAGELDWEPSPRASPELAAMVQEALARPSSVNERGLEGWTPLLQAASEGNWEICEWLVTKAGADMEKAHWQGATPLLVACSNVSASNAARVLLRLGANAKAVDEDQRGALHHAAQTGSPELLLELAQSGADSALKDSRENTPLMLWARCGPEPLSMERGEMLLAMETDLNARSDTGCTALRFACWWADGWIEGVEALLAAGADPNVADQKGETPLISVCRGAGQAKETAAALLKAGADPYARDHVGRCMAERWDQGIPQNGALATVGAWVEARALSDQLGAPSAGLKGKGHSL